MHRPIAASFAAPPRSRRLPRLSASGGVGRSPQSGFIAGIRTMGSPSGAKGFVDDAPILAGYAGCPCRRGPRIGWERVSPFCAAISPAWDRRAGGIAGGGSCPRRYRVVEARGNRPASPSETALVSTDRDHTRADQLVHLQTRPVGNAHEIEVARASRSMSGRVMAIEDAGVVDGGALGRIPRSTDAAMAWRSFQHPRSLFRKSFRTGLHN